MPTRRTVSLLTDLGHLRPLRSWAGAHLKRRARRYAAVAASLSHAYMQEGIAGAIRELHEAEPLLGIVPLDGGAAGQRPSISPARSISFARAIPSPHRSHSASRLSPTRIFQNLISCCEPVEVPVGRRGAESDGAGRPSVGPPIMNCEFGDGNVDAHSQ